MHVVYSLEAKPSRLRERARERERETGLRESQKIEQRRSFLFEALCVVALAGPGAASTGYEARP